MKVDEPKKTPTDLAIEQCTKSIERESLFLYDKHAWLTVGQRIEIRGRISMLMANREKLVNDGFNEIQLLPMLHQPGPQSEQEKIALIKLIDSVV